MMYGYYDVKRLGVGKGMVNQRRDTVPIDIKPHRVKFSHPKYYVHSLHRRKKVENDFAYRMFMASKRPRPKRIKLSLISLENSNKTEKVDFLVITVKNVSGVVGVKVGYTKDKNYDTADNEFLVPDFDENGKVRGFFICKSTGFESIIQRSIENNVGVEKAFFNRTFED